MTVDEAVQLVLQSAAMAQEEVFVWTWVSPCGSTTSPGG